MTLLYSKTMNDLISNDSSLHRFLTLMEWMVWLRIIPLLAIGILCLFLSCILCAFCCIDREKHRERLQRLPLVRNFLQENARKYDKSKDYEEECCICMEKYDEESDKQIAELACS
jgi:hypothetical protein